MSRPRIFTSEFWARRIDALTDNIPRMVRTGAQGVLGGLFVSDAGPINAFDVDWYSIGGSFLGGCVLWILTTAAAPYSERPPGP